MMSLRQLPCQPTWLRMLHLFVPLGSLRLAASTRASANKVITYRRMAVMCPLCGSLRRRSRNIPFNKYRNVGPAQAELGGQEPVAYLAVGCSCRAVPHSLGPHRLRPSAQQVKGYMRSHCWQVAGRGAHPDLS